ncbi:MAG TPA: ACP S-malonyltransferase [Chlamydiales bacterium]|jgi:[acyl-carrier-protein] S-malonyltransferase|nr:ACP S-malonyltransferase [Chlamydiales bacterium]
MKKITFLFPGQGAQYPGMGKDFWANFSIAKETFQEADDLLKESLSTVIFDGSEAELTKTKNSQTGIFVLSVAITRVLQQQLPSLVPTVVSGLSLGEYSALWASGRLSFKDTLLLVRERARLMNEACERTAGTMAAVLGMNAADIDEALRGVPEVWVANYNCPGQTVISGTKEGVENGCQRLKAAGAKRLIPLQVQGAFHSGLMQSAEIGLAPFVERAPLLDSKVGFVMNASGDFVTSLEEIRRQLVSQVTHSVRWEQGIAAIEKRQTDLYLEIGCGKTLSGLNKKIGVAAPTLSVDKLADLEAAVSQIEENSSCKHC